MKGLRIDGNNILEVYEAVKKEAEEMRERPRPVLIECETFRMRGHEEASGTKYVPDELFEYWEQRDPVSNFESYLLDEGTLTADEVLSIRKELKSEIEQAVQEGFSAPDPEAHLEKELSEVYAPVSYKEVTPSGSSKEMRMIDSIRSGLWEAMEKHPGLVLMGQDIADYGGVFKITDGFLDAFGSERVRNTPLCESAIIGTALGLSLCGHKAMVEMQFADFVTVGFNQIINNLAKLHYRWGEKADVVIRMPTGGTVGAGPFHSQSNEAWFTHTPGLKVVYPSTPSDAKGLLLTAFEDPNPIMFFEHKGLYRSVSEEVSEGYFTIPFGKARSVRSGNQATIITYGMGVKWASDWAEENQADVDIIDLRTLIPLDWEAIAGSIQKTHRVLVLHEDTLTGGFGADVAAKISEELFEYLDAPVMRCASLDSPVPFSSILEDQFMASRRLEEKMNALLEY
jgi:2-oxoisovalerate dehydrogenase E1 component